MSHPEQRSFCFESLVRYEDRIGKALAVLDAGSLDINGCNRDMFPDLALYLGVDLARGPNVDLICPVHEVQFPDDFFDVAISTEMFEHDRHWAESVMAMVRMLRPGGVMIFTCATEGRPEHGTARTSPTDSPHTLDYYRNLTEADFRGVAGFTESFDELEFRTHHGHHDLYFAGVKHAIDE